jgi:hypothetical protein
VDALSARAGHPVAALVVSDLTAAAIVGMSGRQLRRFVAEHAVPHCVWRRHVYVRADRLLEALDRLSGAAPLRQWDEGAVVEMAARGARKAGAS